MSVFVRAVFCECDMKCYVKDAKIYQIQERNILYKLSCRVRQLKFCMGEKSLQIKSYLLLSGACRCQVDKNTGLEDWCF